jgi:hypothetical protein
MPIDDFDRLQGAREEFHKYEELKHLESDNSVSSKFLANGFRKIQENIDRAVDGEGPYGSLGKKHAEARAHEDIQNHIAKAQKVRQTEIEDLKGQAKELQKNFEKDKHKTLMSSEDKARKAKDEQRIKRLSGMTDEEVEAEIMRYLGDGPYYRESIEYLDELSKQARDRKLKTHKKLRDTMNEANAEMDALHLTLDGMKLDQKIKVLKQNTPRYWQINKNGAPFAIDLTDTKHIRERLIDLTPLSILR